MAKGETAEKAEVVEGFGDNLEKYRQLVQSPELMDPGTVAQDIARRILDSNPDSIEAILAMGDTSTEDARDIADRPFIVTETPQWYNSTFKEGPGVFVAVPLHFLDTDTDGVVTVGGSNVVAQLFVMQTKNFIPSLTPMKFVIKKSARGFDVLWLSQASK